MRWSSIHSIPFLANPETFAKRPLSSNPNLRRPVLRSSTATEGGGCGRQVCACLVEWGECSSGVMLSRLWRD